jgi:SAM-dependent methyltransferase
MNFRRSVEQQIEEAEDKPFFWSYISREEMQRLVVMGREKGVEEPIEEILGPRPAAGYYRALLDEDRGDFSFLWDVPPDAKVLDFGSGWGTTALALARRFSGLLALDATRENLEFARLRAREAGRENILFVHVEPLERFQFPCAPGTVDAVVLIGILEWVGESSRKGTPQDLQVRFLREIHKVLKRGGSIYLAIENRFGAPYWLGRPDPHAHVPFFSVLPRWAANVLSLLVRGRPYRTYTHSYGKLRKLLKEAGFADFQFYLSLPDYRSPHVLLPLAEPRAIRFWLKNSFVPQRRMHYWQAGMLWLIASLHVLPWLVPDFAVVARRRDD